MHGGVVVWQQLGVPTTSLYRNRKSTCVKWSDKEPTYHSFGVVYVDREMKHVTQMICECTGGSKQ